MAMAELDLSGDVTQGRALKSTLGGVPDFFYRCKSRSELRPCIVFEEASIDQVSEGVKRIITGVPRGSRC
eukprot:552578-Pyramimonas_sp.AAC.1